MNVVCSTDPKHADNDEKLRGQAPPGEDGELGGGGGDGDAADEGDDPADRADGDGGERERVAQDVCEGEAVLHAVEVQVVLPRGGCGRVRGGRREALIYWGCRFLGG